MKITEDVPGGDTGPIDHAPFWHVPDRVPQGLTGMFEAITAGGSVGELDAADACAHAHWQAPSSANPSVELFDDGARDQTIGVRLKGVRVTPQSACNPSHDAAWPPK